MPSLVKIKVVEGRDLPVMDRNLQGEAFTDSYVDIWIGKHEVQRTHTIRKTLNPVWDEEFRFEIVDDSLLQNTPVEFKVMDQNISSSELIGIVYVDLNPLIMRTAYGSDKDSNIEGWFPLYDSLRGIQGSLHVIIKLQFIDNDNPFRDSSAGVQFFSTSSLSPSEFVIQEVLGLVVDLVVEDDPEMSWHDYFRGAKSSNDSRMRVLYRLSATVRKEVGKKVIEAGGNAVLGYMSHFDVEGDSGIVARAYGTACRILKVEHSNMADSRLSPTSDQEEPFKKGISFSSPRDNIVTIDSGMLKPVNLSTHLYRNIHGSLTSNLKKDENLSYQLISFGPSIEKSANQMREQAQTSRYAARLSAADLATTGISNDHYQSDVELLSLKSFDEHVRVRFGGLVMAKSVKFLGKLQSSLSDQETREAWWEELRAEIRNHASILCCTHVIGYTETCTLHGDVCVLVCIGTAAVIKKGFSHPYLHLSEKHNPDSLIGDLYSLSPNIGDDLNNIYETQQSLTPDSPVPALPPFSSQPSIKKSPAKVTRPKCLPRPCAFAHVPYNRSRAPFAGMRLVPCLMCGSKWVPEYIVTTTQPSEYLPIRGKGKILEVVVHRARKSISAAAEIDAVKMSELLPFVEFDIQKQLMLKLKILGMNAAMGYSSSLNFSSSMVIATATCTAVYLEPLPPPPTLHLLRSSKEMKLEGDLIRVEERIEKIYSINKQTLDVASLRSKSRRRQSSGSGPQLQRTRSRSHSAVSEEIDKDKLSSSSSSSSSPSSSSDENDSYTTSLDSPSSSSSSEDSGKDDDKSFTRSPEARRKRISHSPPDSDDGKNIPELNAPVRRKKNVKKKLYEDERKPYVLEVDDETDLDLMCALADRWIPDNIDFVNTQVAPGSDLKCPFSPNVKEIKLIKRFKMPQRPASSGLRGGVNHVITDFFQKTYARLCFHLRNNAHCEILGLSHHVTLMEDDVIELLVIAMAHYTTIRQMLSTLPLSSDVALPTTSFIPTFPDGPTPMIPIQSYAFGVQETILYDRPVTNQTLPTTSQLPSATLSHSLDGAEAFGNMSSLMHQSSVDSLSNVNIFSHSMDSTHNYDYPSKLSRASTHRPSWQPVPLGVPRVTLSSLCYIPGTRIVQYLGPLQLHFIKESWTVRGEGLLGSFLHRFITEVDAATRAQVAALGGNALLCRRVVPLESGSGVSRNQAYNMVSVYGDVVLVEPSSNLDQHGNPSVIEKLQITIPMGK